MQFEKKKQILVIKHGALGDLIQSFGILMDIRRYYQDSEITLLTAPTYIQLMLRCPYVDNVIVDNRVQIWRINEQLKLQKKLNKHSFELVIDLQNSDRSRMYKQFWFSKTEWIGRNKKDKSPESGLSGLISLLTEAGIDVENAYNPNMSWMLEDVRQKLNQHQIGQEYIVLIPGSSAKHLVKRWPHYAELAKALTNLKHQVVMILGPEEKDIDEKISGHILKGLNWFELASIINNAKFVVGNDTGPIHIASFLNKKGLAIFGPATSAARAEIKKHKLGTIEVDNLLELNVKQVLYVLQKTMKEAKPLKVDE